MIGNTFCGNSKLFVLDNVLPMSTTPGIYLISFYGDFKNMKVSISSVFSYFYRH